MLGGVVIGSVSDLGSVFYNPGMLGLYGEPSVNISAKVVQFSALKPTEGDGSVLKTSSLSTLPSLAGGSLRLSKDGNDMLAFSILTRQISDVEFSGWSTFGQGSLPPPPAGYDYANAEGRYKQSMEDIWVGVTYATRLSDNIGIGVTQFVSVRSQETGARLLVQGNMTSGGVSTLNTIKDFEYISYSTLTKIGVGFDSDPLTVGMNFTTPALNIMGSGSVAYNQTRSNTSSDLIATTSQQDIDAKYKTPLAVGGGGSFRIDSLRVHVSAEWYDGVDRYDVLDAAPFSTGTDGVERDVLVQEALEPVFNYGIGFEYRFNPSFHIYLAYSTDRSAASGGPGSTIALWRNDLHQITGGVLFSLGKSEFTLGLNDTFGPQKVEVPSDIDGNTKVVELQLTRLRAMIGYAFNF
jgi:hypothetical protein